MCSDRRLLLVLSGVFALGATAWGWQLATGLWITGLSREVSWGLYISQFTFLVGVAASAVMVTIPFHLHGFRPFGRLLPLGEALAVAAIVSAGLFVLVDLGRPDRLMNLLRHPSVRSPMFWDMLCLGGYLGLNLALLGVSVACERRGRPSPGFVRPLCWLSVPLAISIHTVTAFLYSGLPGRPSWETAVLAPRFLASAFASGPSLLLLLCLALAREPDLDVGRDATRALARIVAWALAANAFLLGCELFTALYARHPEHLESLHALWLDPAAQLWPWAWGGQIACAVAFVVLLRARDDRRMALAAALAFTGVWMEKGMGLVVSGFSPAPLGGVPGYLPTLPETAIALGVWAAGALAFMATRGAVRWGRGSSQA